MSDIVGPNEGRAQLSAEVRKAENISKREGHLGALQEMLIGRPG